MWWHIFIMFATLFAVYAVLRNNTFGGPSGKELFNLPYVFVQTLILLGASLTSGIGGVYAHRENKKSAMMWFGVTFLLGATFLAMGVMDFARLINMGAVWQVSGYLSAYYSLIGTHTVHVIIGLIWIIVLMIPVVKYGLEAVHVKRLTCLRMFWQFINVVWVFIFIVVYLMGVNGYGT